MLTNSSVACDTFSSQSSRESILEAIKEIVSESSGVPAEQIDEHQTRLRELPWDSLDSVECAMEIEEHFGIAVPDEMVDQANTIGDLADGVLALLSRPPAES